MLKKTPKYYFLLATVLIVLVFGAVAFLLPGKVVAVDDLYGVNYGASVGLSGEDIRITIVKVIRAILGTLGVIALILILYAGFIWMTSGGNEQNIAKAKKIILNAVIGLVIIMMAFAIVQYVFSVLSGSGGTAGGGGFCSIGSCSSCLRCVDRQNFVYDPSCSSSCSGGPGGGTDAFKIESVQTAHGAVLPAYSSNPEKSNVFWCSKVQAVLNHEIDNNTVVSSFAAPNGDPSDPLRTATLVTPESLASGKWETFGNVLVFTPKDNIFTNKKTAHLSHFPTSLKDLSKRGLSQCANTAECKSGPPPDFTWDFYVGEEGDTENPYITNTYPKKDTPYDQSVSRDPILEINFSENIDATTLFSGTGNSNPSPAHFVLEEIDKNGNVVTAVNNTVLAAKMSGQGFRVSLISPNLLKAFTSYRVTIKDIADLCGNKMDPASFSWQFTTNDQVPGIGSYYPTGDKNCPNVKPSINFNTTMREQKVEFTISEYTVVNNQVQIIQQFNFILQPGATSVSNSAGTFRVTDVGDPSAPGYTINDHFRAYEFVPSGDLKDNSKYHISVVTDKILDADRNVLTKAWDFEVTDLANCACSPYLSSLSREQGPVGECLTLYGQCFKGTSAKPAEISNIKFGSKSASIPNLADYSDDYVVTTVPNGLNAGDKPKVEVSLQYQGTSNAVPPSNQKEFTILAGQADGPCLWAIHPDRGDRGSKVELSGIRFGSFGTTHEAIFTPAATAIYQIKDSATWSDTSIRDVVVPASAIDGEIKLKNDQGLSNGVPFNVNFCGDGNIDPGEECDGSDTNGKTCADVGFIGGSLGCGASCKFDKANCSNAPGVVENSLCALACVGGTNNGKNCSNNTDCPSGACQIKTDGLPSPNPRPGVTNACLNAAISVLFNTDIKSSTLVPANIYLQKCNTDNCQDDNSNSANPKPGVIATPIIVSLTTTARSFVLTPTQNLEPNTTYQVTIKKDISNLAGVGMPNDYLWIFKTKSSTAPCPIDRVYVEPHDITVNGNVPTPYNAKAIAPFLSANCSLINANNYNWQWNIEDNNNPTIGVSLSGGGPAVTVTSGNKSGTVSIKVETEGKQDQATLHVFVDSCTIDAECAANCPGSTCDIPTKRCKPVIKSLTPSSGTEGRWVTVNGCYFKSGRGSGNVAVGGETVTTYPCGEKWSDQEIVIAIPERLGGWGNQPVNVIDQYGLISNVVDFNLIDECIAGTKTPASGLPGLCSLSPTSGKWGDTVILSGENFGTTAKNVKFTGNASTVLNGTIGKWDNNNITTKVPDNTITGVVFAEVDGCPSNSLDFTLTSGGVGSSCNSDSKSTTCTKPDNGLCWNNLICNPTTCQCETPPKAKVITGSLTPPATNACRNSLVKATFDQKLDGTTVNENTILVFKKTDTNLGGKCYDETQLALLDDGPKSRNFFSLIFNKIKNLFQPNKAKAAGGYWYCPVTGSVRSTDVNEKIDSCNNKNGCTTISFSPSKIFDGDADYLALYLGGDNGLKTTFGQSIETNYNSPALKDSFRQVFRTKNEICKISNVQIDVLYKGGQRTATTRDYFTCAGRDNCVDDIDGTTMGNQHKYLAQALDKDKQQLVASYQWQENPTDLLTISSASQKETNMTPALKSGETTVRVTASDPDLADNLDYGSATRSVIVTNSICSNPWPSYTGGFPYADSSSNCNVSGASNCIDMTFTTFYCRDFGQSTSFCQSGSNAGQECSSNVDCPGSSCLDSTADDLPALDSPKVKGREKGYCVGGDKSGAECSDESVCAPTGHCYNSVKEFMFFVNPSSKKCSGSNLDCTDSANCPSGQTCEVNNDSLGIRIYNNGDHLSPQAWAQKYENNPANGAIGKIDGYESMTAGRTAYVNMAVHDKGKGSIFTNMFLVSHTDNPDLVTTEIYNQILKNLAFNSNQITNNRVCTSGTSPGTYCTKDSDCGSGGVCDANKDKLARDVIRVGHLGQIIYALEKYRGTCSAHPNLPCTANTQCPNNSGTEVCTIAHTTYPTLTAGTYKVGQSVSLWDSWGATFTNTLGLGALKDPLNGTPGCDSGYNNECWNDATKDFQCPAGSFMYHYESIDGNTYNLYTNMEYSVSQWGGGFQTFVTQPCKPGTYDLVFQKK